MGNFMSAGLVLVFCLCSSSAQDRAWHIGSPCKDLLSKGTKGVATGHRLSAPYPCPFSLSQDHRQTISYKLGAAVSTKGCSLVMLMGNGKCWRVTAPATILSHEGRGLVDKYSSFLTLG